MKTLVQVGNVIEEFSDAPFKSQGIKHCPKWPISKAYKQCIQNHNSNLRRLPKDIIEQQERQYIAWKRFGDGDYVPGSQA